jgi:GTP pyrophosphokinase
LDSFFEYIKNINSIDLATKQLKSEITETPLIKKALSFCIQAHQGQQRKSGEDYAVHPILVAAIAARFSNDEAMVISALLHDVVEDTEYSLKYIKQQYTNDIAHIVDGLTKIDLAKTKSKQSSSNSKTLASALTFRKMLLASIEDVRILVLKLCDRVHNMLTLDALTKEKQKRIAEETIIVYAPIAHRLGISLLKNTLEDLSFMYLYPNEYQQIDNYIKKAQQQIQLDFNNFISQTKSYINQEAHIDTQIQIFSRIKHYYSIYLKMQRKGIGIDEVLDLLAIRIIVENEIDCYKVVGVIHTNYKPLVARFKDYVAIPKENGYQTIHTTVFFDSKIYEVQVRTKTMHKIAEYGVAAHWKYKNRSMPDENINLHWLHALELTNDDVEEFYSEAKQDLYSEDIVVYSPKGDVFNLPRNSTAYDFAYEIHSDVGNCAYEAYINKIRQPLLTQLNNGDIVSIKVSSQIILRCSWLDMVKTTKAKRNIKLLCSNRLKKIDQLSGKNILNTIFSRLTDNITKDDNIDNFQKIPYNLDYLKNIKKIIEKKVRKHSIIDRVKLQSIALKEYKLENIIVYSNFSINSISFDHCCHPKIGDDIVAFRDGKTAIVHHKMCENAYEQMKQSKQMLFCKWVEDRFYTYKTVISIPNTRGELAKVLTHLAKYEATIVFIEYGKDKYSAQQYCALDFEINNSNTEAVKHILEQKAKIIEFYSGKDAYK